jgi:hypothetical protein
MLTVIETITFALAMLGFGLLTIHVIFPGFGRTSRWPSVETAAVIVAHVVLVWTFRYEWSFAEATRNGQVGFAIFHTALLAVVLSTVVSRKAAQSLMVAAYLTVCVGASGAVFRYDVVEMYRIPVLSCVGLGVAALAWRLNRSRGGGSSRKSG